MTQHQPDRQSAVQTPPVAVDFQAVAQLAAVDELRTRVRGEVLLAGETGYEEARRLWNGMVDRRPALIARCTGAADVMRALRFAREHGLPVTVRGGGHNVAGTAVGNGAVVIDLGRMNGVRVDPERGRVRVGGGARLGDVDHETQAFGMAVPMGVVSRTGIAGLALHGGMGFLLRRYGLTCDHLVAADVVTADGRQLVADEAHHADLLWALRGGGGGFGVVTSFEFRLQRVGPEVAVAIAMYPLSRAVRGLRFFRDFMAAAPDEVMALAVLWNTPHEPAIPAGAQGVPALIFVGVHAGPAEEGERALRPLRELATPLADLSGRMPYLEAQRIFDPDYPDGRRYYWKSTFLESLTDEVIEALVEHTVARPSPISSLDVWALGGAMGRVGRAETAFARRDAPFLLGIEANWDDPGADEANVEWAREVYRDAQRFSAGGAYLNFPGFVEEGEALLRASYGENYERLQAIKAGYDPGNLFPHALSAAARPEPRPAR